jgi:hypothetical protein
MLAVSGALTLHTAYLRRGRCDRIGAGGSAARPEADNGWAAGMGTIVKFPDDGRIVRFGRAEGAEESATVIILPVVRIERYDEPRAADVEPYTRPPAENGGRRRMRRR